MKLVGRKGQNQLIGRSHGAQDSAPIDSCFIYDLSLSNFVEKDVNARELTVMPAQINRRNRAGEGGEDDGNPAVESRRTRSHPILICPFLYLSITDAHV